MIPTERHGRDLQAWADLWAAVAEYGQRCCGCPNAALQVEQDQRRALAEDKIERAVEAIVGVAVERCIRAPVGSDTIDLSDLG